MDDDVEAFARARKRKLWTRLFVLDDTSLIVVVKQETAPAAPVVLSVGSGQRYRVGGSVASSAFGVVMGTI
jgi:hypothetical protein